jgi:hypothetical protein
MAQAPPCPYCDSSSYQLQDKRWLTCQVCGHEFDLTHDLCRACGHLNLAEAKVCGHCRARLPRDTVSELIEARAKTRKQWYEERALMSPAHKSKEEEASQQRMEAFWAEENARRQAVAQAAAEQQRRERKVLLVVGIVATLLILLLIVAAIVIFSLTPDVPQVGSSLTYPLA